MNDNGKERTDFTPGELVAFLESLYGYPEPPIDHASTFVQFLDHEEPTVRAAAIQGLWFSADPDLIDRLIDIAEHDPSAPVRAAAVSTLGVYIYTGEAADYDVEMGPLTDMLIEDELSQADFERVKAFLLGVYADQDRTLDERRFAVEALGFLSDSQVANLVEEIFNRPEREMKISALMAMGRSGLLRWIDVLAQEMYNPDHDIQLEAVRAAGHLGAPELGSDLLRMTFSDDREIMLEAIEALGRSGWDAAFERLEELTEHADQEIAEIATEALDEWLWINEIQSGDELDTDLDADWYDEY